MGHNTLYILVGLIGLSFVDHGDDEEGLTIPPEPSANIFHDPAVCGGRITGTREQLTCDKCGQRFTLDQVQQQFDSSALSEALKALHRFEIDSALRYDPTR